MAKVKVWPSLILKKFCEKAYRSDQVNLHARVKVRITESDSMKKVKKKRNMRLKIPLLVVRFYLDRARRLTV